MSEWISVEDRLPEVGDFVDIWSTGKRVADVEFLSNPGAFCGAEGGFDIPLEDVTHWMPLPEPPRGHYL